MIRNGTQWDTVVLDPPRFIHSRDDEEAGEGRRKYGGRNGRRLQFFDRTGAAPDHPVMSNCLDSRYLKVLWGRVF